MGLLVDNFSGGGGASVALEKALGRNVDIAVNHDAAAIAMHEANHPHTKHYQEDVYKVNPATVCAGRAIDVAWFSPDCTHHSRARGGKPRSNKIRGLAWVVLKWASLPKWQKPRVIFLENVEEFQTWGPLDKKGQPIKEKAASTFLLWVSHLQALGYKVEWKTLKASDYGAPTIRKRLFLVARCDGEPIRWPEPTHGRPTKGSKLLPWRTASEIIDWSIPCPSIFERKRPLVENTMKRIARGLQRYVIDEPNPFIVQVTQSSNLAPKPIYEPLRTITTAKGGEFAIVSPTLVQCFGESVARDVSEPVATLTGKNKQMLVAAFLAQHNTGMTGHDMRKPLSTIVGRGTQQQIVTSHMIKLRGTCKDGQSVKEPVPTITAGGKHLGEVRAFMLKYYGTATGQDIAAPLGSITTRDRFGLVMVHGEPYQICDIGMRMLSPRELFNASGFPADYIIRPIINGKQMSKSASIARCGNAVPPDPAEALIKANAPMFSRLAAA